MRWILIVAAVTAVWYLFFRQQRSETSQGGDVAEETIYQSHLGRTVTADNFGTSIPSRPVTNVGTAVKSGLQKAIQGLGIIK